MPRVNIYIRKEDEEKWGAIENKPEWLHDNLNKHEPDVYFLSPKVAKEHPELVAEFDKLATLVDDSTETVKVGKLFRTNYEGTDKEEVCEHYQTKGECLVKGCKYNK